MKYRNLAELAAAFGKGELDGCIVMLDNDTVSVKGFEMHPEDVLDQALTLLGIPHEHV
jgi:hypothetical protein